MWTHNSFFPFYCNSQKNNNKFWRGFWLEKFIVCIAIRDELKTLKSEIAGSKIPNLFWQEAPLCLRGFQIRLLWRLSLETETALLIKPKILFSVLSKKTQSIFILDNCSTYNHGLNEKKIFVLEKSNREIWWFYIKHNLLHSNALSYLNGFQCSLVIFQEIFSSSSHWRIQKSDKQPGTFFIPSWLGGIPT